jgi:Fe-S-cluster containining protein
MSLIQIQKIAERIPAFECIPGCTDCCGPVPFSPSEWEAVPDKRPMPSTDLGEILAGLYQGGAAKCSYASEAGCAIYAHRPLMCRLFGTVEDLRCPHGKRPDDLLTAMQGKTILRHYVRQRKEETHDGSSDSR